MRKIVVVAVLLLLELWTASANLSEWFFCQVRKNEVVISLKKTDSFYKCSDTIASLEGIIIQTAKDLMTIQIYLNRHKDIEYRSTVKKDKLATLDKLQAARKGIIDNMNAFESNLVKKSVQWFVLTITPYKINLQKSLLTINTLTLSGFATPEINAYAALLKAQVDIIDNIAKSTTMAALDRYLVKYIYLKKTISWRYE